MVVDSSAIVAILAGEPQANLFEEAIVKAAVARMSVVSAVELHLVRSSRPQGRQGPVIPFVQSLGIELVPVDIEQMRWACIAFDRFGKGRHPAALNFGDCFSYALARSLNEPLLFKGNDFALTDIAPALSP